LALLLLSLFSLATSIRQVEAWNGTVFIHADGSIDPPVAPINQNGNVYTLTDDIISSGDGIVIEISSITVDGNGHVIQGSSSGSGFNLTGTSDVTIRNANVEGFSLGIVLVNASQDVISGNNVTTNQINGVVLSSSDYNTIASNNIQQNSASGVYLDSSSNNNISSNNIQQNDAYGIWVSSSSNNNIYNNNLVNNTQQVYTTYDSTDTWDEGYPDAGNYWTDYTGQDVCNGTFQNATGSDGIGDTPYVLDQNNLDNYPLMKPYPWDSHDIGITYIGKIWAVSLVPPVFPLKTTVGLGLALHINVFVMNYGTYFEVFNVTVYANTSAIDALTGVTLGGRTSTILDFTWNTTGFAMGNYAISAIATPVPGETDTRDNTFTAGRVTLTIPGDVNGDYRVTLSDLVLLANAYGTTPVSGGKPGVPGVWNPNADINGDGKVGLSDLVLLANHYGQHYP
jgi:parallel beta-helix repeat protein